MKQKSKTVISVLRARHCVTSMQVCRHRPVVSTHSARRQFDSVRLATRSASTRQPTPWWRHRLPGHLTRLPSTRTHAHTRTCDPFTGRVPLQKQSGNCSEKVLSHTAGVYPRPQQAKTALTDFDLSCAAIQLHRTIFAVIKPPIKLLKTY